MHAPFDRGRAKGRDLGKEKKIIWKKNKKEREETQRKKIKQFRQELPSTSIKYSSRFLRAWGADHIRREVLYPAPV